MKKTLYTLLAIFSLSACNFLDEPLKGAFTSEDYFTSAEKAEMAVNGIYNSLYGHNLWVFADVASDDAEKGGNAGDQVDINYIANFTAAADNGQINNFWQHTYETISRANNVIKFVGEMDIDEALKTRYVSEAKVLRAYMYFQLVNIFGQVPLKLNPQNTSEDIHVGLSSVETIYAQIDKDLSEAAAGLPVEYAPTEAGRLTKGAALGFLAKSKVFQAKWAEALTAINTIKTECHYDLLENYADNFKRGAEDSVESVFAIRYMNNTTAQRGNNLVVWFASKVASGYYFNAPTQAYVDSFTEKTLTGEVDPRLDASIGRDGKPWFNGLTFSKDWSPTGYLVKKYGEDLPEGEAIAQSTLPQNILRYADILLLEAEALNENNGDPSEPLKKIRGRVGLDTNSLAGMTKEQRRELIRNERRHELGFEFHRFFDVIRYGKEYTKRVLPDFPWDSARYYYPLPQAETDVNTSITK